VIKKRKVPGMKVFGLTSNRNMAFTKKLGLYDEVVSYDEMGNVDVGQERWIYVDVAGNKDVNEKVVKHFGGSGRLAANIALGFTNLSPSTSPSASPDWSTNTFQEPASQGAQESFFMGVLRMIFIRRTSDFFPVEWLNVRKHQISAQTIFRMQNEAWKELLEDGKNWVKLERVYGPENVKKAYAEIIKGDLGPDKGFIWSMWDKGELEHVMGKL
jgi:hypothetical protein